MTIPFGGPCVPPKTQSRLAGLTLLAVRIYGDQQTFPCQSMSHLLYGAGVYPIALSRFISNHRTREVYYL